MFRLLGKEKAMIAVAVIASAILFAVIVLAYLNIRLLVDTSRWVTHTERVSHLIDTVLLDLSELENAQRTFALTGASQYLESFRASVSELSRDLDMVEALATDSEVQSRVTQVRPLIEKRIVFSERTIQTRQTSGLEAASNVVLTGEGQQLTQEIRGLLMAMQRDEAELFEPSHDGGGARRRRLAAHDRGRRRHSTRARGAFRPGDRRQSQAPQGN